MIERLLAGLAVAAAVAATLLSFRLPQPDLCDEARRLATDILTAYRSRGVLAGDYRLPSVAINQSGVYCAECLVFTKVPMCNSTVLAGRQRLLIAFDSTSKCIWLLRRG